MFQNYLKTAVRNLLRYKGFTLINLLGLLTGITGCLLIGLFVQDEHRYDKGLPGGENIYRIYNEQNSAAGTTYMAPVQPAFANFLQGQYAEVDTTVRILMSGTKFLVERGEKNGYEEKGLFVDGSFFHLFQLPLLKGDPLTALMAPQTVVISEDMADRYFGSIDPIGQSLYIDKDTFEVKGVMAPLPAHFHLQFNYLISLPSAGIPKERMESWGWNQFYTYIKLKPGTDATHLQNKFQAYVKKEIYPLEAGSGNTFLPFFQKLEDIHLHSSDFVYDNAVRGNASYVKGLTVIALFVLAIACFNFINLATARSVRRAREIGVRKVVGAGRRQLVMQFVGETILLSLLAMVLAMVTTMLLLPALNAFTGKNIAFNPATNLLLALAILVGGILIGIFAGIYPAFVLSGFQPVKVLKGMKPGVGGSVGWLRQSLVVLQFSLSALLIVSALIVYRQVSYLNNKELGFDKEQLVFFQIRGGLGNNLETFKSELKRSPNVVSVTSGYGLPGDQFAGETVTIPNATGEREKSTSVFIGDHDYIKTLGLKLIAGRDFSREMATDVREAFVINETAAREFGFGTPEKAIGQRINWEEWEPADTTDPVKRGQVIGVVLDFHYKSLHEKVSPAVIQLYPTENFKVAVKLKAVGISQTLSFISDTWSRFSPGYPIDFKFMDETYATMYKAEEKLATLIWVFTLMAIAVGCMGLFGLAAFGAEQRIKEIGIRKVLGASVVNLVGLLSKNFLLLVLLSSVLAFPVAWYAMNKWLEDFSYRIEIGWWVFAVAALATVFIALLTVSFQAVKAAIANPVKNLRTD